MENKMEATKTTSKKEACLDASWSYCGELAQGTSDYARTQAWALATMMRVTSSVTCQGLVWNLQCRIRLPKIEVKGLGAAPCTDWNTPDAVE